MEVYAESFLGEFKFSLEQSVIPPNFTCTPKLRNIKFLKKAHCIRCYYKVYQKTRISLEYEKLLFVEFLDKLNIKSVLYLTALSVAMI